MVIAVQAVSDHVNAPHERYLQTLSTGSRKSMRSAFRVVAPMLGAESPDAIDWAKCDRGMLLDLRDRLQRSSYAPATSNRILTAVRGALREAGYARLVPSDKLHDALAVPLIRSQRKAAGRSLTEAEIQAIYNQCDATSWGRRSLAILALLYGGGLRCNEAIRARTKDYDVRSRMLTVVYGKGNKERLVPFNEAAAEDLERWMYTADWPGQVRILVGIRSRSRKPTGEPLQRTGVLGVLNQLADLGGVKRFTPHDLRRTMITGLLAAGVDVLVVGRIVGHQRPDTTLIYDRRPIEAEVAATAHLYMPSKREGGGRL